MKKLTKEQRQQRVIAKGEHSNHSHVMTGDVVIKNENGEIIVEVGCGGAILKHILESNYVETGEEIWTEEHKDIPFKEGTYKFVQQQEYSPYNDAIQKVRD